MHLRTEELLALRDGEAAPEIAEHVRDCTRCAAELEHLWVVERKLALMPAAPPPNDRWPDIRAAVEAGRSKRRTIGRAVVAAAAAMLLVVGAAVLWPRPEAPPAMVDTAWPVDDHVTQLIAASQQLESVLEEAGLESKVLSSRDAARIVQLEDRIAVIDARLAEAEHPVAARQAVQLWLDRVELLDSLVEIRGSGESAPALQRASYQ